MWNQFSVSGNDRQYFPAFYICTGTGLLGKIIRKTSDGTHRGRYFF